MDRVRTHLLVLLILITALISFSSCGVLRKRPADTPEQLAWVGPEGAVADVRILLHPNETTIVLDADTIDLFTATPSLLE